MNQSLDLISKLHQTPIQHLSKSSTSFTHLTQHIPSTSSSPSFYTVDLTQVLAQLSDFHTHLPTVTPFYAIKCNPDPILLTLLAHHGASFDCASQPELLLAIKTLTTLSLPIPNNIIFANAVKSPSDLTFAANNNISLLTFDSIDELEKIHQHHPAAKLLLRVAVDDSNSLCPLSSKFGATPPEIPHILDKVKHLALNLIGVAFHAGSGSMSVTPYASGISLAKSVFQQAARIALPPLTLLDIGGGFPGHDQEAPITFAEIAATIRHHLADFPNVNVIAEPGRFFVTSAFRLACRVLLDRSVPRKPVFHISEGVFSAFRDAHIFRVRYPPFPLQCSRGDKQNNIVAEIRGPTRDPVDLVCTDVQIQPLTVGDWVYFENMGAYTSTLACRHAGEKPPVHYFVRLHH